MADDASETVFEPGRWPPIRIVGIVMLGMTILAYTMMQSLASRRRIRLDAMTEESDHPDTIRILQTRTLEVSSEEEAKLNEDLELSLSGSSDEEAPHINHAGAGDKRASEDLGSEPKQVSPAATFPAISQTKVWGSFEDTISL